jgi:hypothetical protein
MRRRASAHLSQSVPQSGWIVSARTSFAPWARPPTRLATACGFASHLSGHGLGFVTGGMAYRACRLACWRRLCAICRQHCGRECDSWKCQHWPIHRPVRPAGGSASVRAAQRLMKDTHHDSKRGSGAGTRGGRPGGFRSHGANSDRGSGLSPRRDTFLPWPVRRVSDPRLPGKPKAKDQSDLSSGFGKPRPLVSRMLMGMGQTEIPR